MSNAVYLAIWLSGYRLSAANLVKEFAESGNLTLGTLL